MKNLNNLKNIEYNCEITKLVKLWENTFKHEISPEEDFYAIGGNSLIMMRLIKKIEETFNLKISPMKFIELSNIINIAKYIVENGDNLNKEKNFPLSSIQEAYYIGRNSEYEMGGVSTHVYFEVKTEFDIEKLTNSLNILIDKQPSLRTIFIDEHKQKVMDTVEKYCIEYEDCSDVSEEIIQHRINNIRDELSKTVLSPNTWPLFKIKALKNVQGKTILFINIDLLIMDGASIGLFMRQWRDICEDKDIKNVKFDFFKYRNQEKDDKNTKEYFDDKKYWKNISPEIPEKPNLNLKDKTKNIKNFNSKRVSKEISLDLFNKIYIQASKRNVSISVALCTAYAYILGYWSNQNNLSINVTTMNRPVYDGIEEVIGEFTKNLILDASLSIDNSFWGNCYSIQTRLLRGLSHQNYDGVEFIRELSKERNLYDGGVMPIVFTSMLFSERQNNINALGEILYSISQTSQVYLDLQISYSSDGVLINWDYVEELFDESMINQMFNQYISLVESLAGENIAYPDLSVHDSNLVKTYNETKEEIPSTTVQDEFSKIVEKY
ncbi:condensation domain protein, partial [Peptoniphilus duerdenii ATCC BAA-1640]